METLAALRNKVGELLVTSIALTGFAGTSLDFLANGGLLVDGEQVGNLTRVEQVVDIF